MEKEFVPYTIAIRLKKLGFNEPCFGYFDCERDFKFVQNKTKYLDCEIPRPTFSQAFRWFRDKYGLKSWIEGTMGGNYIYEIRPHNLADYKEGEVYVYATYEETELACLDKLIEIFESKEK